MLAERAGRVLIVDALGDFGASTGAEDSPALGVEVSTADDEIVGSFCFLTPLTIFT